MPSKGSRKTSSSSRWGYFGALKDFLTAFPLATTGQKTIIAAMGLLVVMFMSLPLIGKGALPAWALFSSFALAAVLVIALALVLLIIERSVASSYRCRHVPIYPLSAEVRGPIHRALEEIRKDAVEQICKTHPSITDDQIRANIFLLAKIQGGASDGQWKLVIQPDFAINMNHPGERQLQFAIGQGATGVAYRDGTYQLTRRRQSPKGSWDIKFQMTPELEAIVEARLMWIISFPLLIPNTTGEAVGVLNIDGLSEVADDDLLNKLATSVRGKVDIIGEALSLQPATCIGFDQLGVLDNA
jgi:hypothetical protein